MPDSSTFAWPSFLGQPHIEKIAAVMALELMPHSMAELDAQVRQGLPQSALREGVGHVASTPEERRALLSRIVPEATFKRRRDRLSPDESEKTERLARIFATADYVWDSEDDARAFLNTAHPRVSTRIVRIADSRHPVWSGTGAMLVGGRSNSPGQWVIYGTLTLAGAMLEVLVHARIGQVPSHHVWVEADVPPDIAVERHAEDAVVNPAHPDAARIGVSRAQPVRWDQRLFAASH
ncbi:hypothetical protein DFQ30_008061 [Apophysomyces sp. BC1015]|nr:hypothetical protein DFQ30_008061 [Apophysomyces sp. BC1015]